LRALLGVVLVCVLGLAWWLLHESRGDAGSQPAVVATSTPSGQDPEPPKPAAAPVAEGVATRTSADTVVEESSNTVEVDPPLEVHARATHPLRVHVVDAASHVDLDDVSVVRTDDSHAIYGDPSIDLRPEELVLQHGVSPFDLAPRDPDTAVQDAFWIGAPGHAWSRMEVDFEKEFDRRVELEPGATIVVDVQGDLPAREPKLRLRRPALAKSFESWVEETLAHFDAAVPSDFPSGVKPSLDEFKRRLERYRDDYEMETATGELLAESAAKSGETRFEGVPIGEFVASIEYGKEWPSPLVAGQVAATLVAVQTTRVALVVGSQAPPAAPVPLSQAASSCRSAGRPGSRSRSIRSTCAARPTRISAPSRSTR
jgi:hypothetical protein